MRRTACEEAGHKLHFLRPHDGQHRFAVIIVYAAATCRDCCCSHVYALYYLILSIIYESCATIFSSGNLEISYDQTGLTRSAVCWSFSSWCSRL